MVGRIRTFLLVVLIPLVVLLGIGAQIYVSKHYEVAIGQSRNLWHISFGIQSIVIVISWVIVLSATALAKNTSAPYQQMNDSIRRIANREFNDAPALTHIDELDETLQSLYATATAARRRLDAERTLAADVSHQLRSPLTALSLRLEEIDRRTQGQEVNDDARAALGQVERLVTMVEDLLTTWRTSSDRTLTSFVVNDVINAEVRRWRDLYEAVGRTIVLNSASKFHALGTVGVQELVLSVLLDNSLKYGAGTTYINVTDYQTWILIEVGDEGQGIREEVRSSLMSPGTSSGGTGLGLAWARRQVAADGGRLELRSLSPAVFGIFLIADRQAEASV
jgi:signal transduction histidine kinase